MLRYTDVQQHEEECDYRRYECPTIGLDCEWSGLRIELDKHFDTVHGYCVLNADKSVPLELTHDINKHIFYKYKKVSFILRIKFEKYLDSLFSDLHSFSKPQEGKKFVFVLTLLNVDETRKYEEKINNFTTYISDDKYDWYSNNMYEINLAKIAHFVNAETKILCKLTILEELS